MVLFVIVILVYYATWVKVAFSLLGYRAVRRS